MMRLIVLIVGVLFATATYAQPSLSPADSVRRLLTTAQPDTNRVHLLLALAHDYIMKMSERTSDLDTALLLSRQAHTLSRRLHYPKGQGLSYLEASQAYREKKQFDQGRTCVQQATTLLSKYGSFVNQADAYSEQAAYYTVSGADLTTAIRLHDRIVSLLQRAGDAYKLAVALKERGDLLQLKSDNGPALRDFHQALKLYQSVGYRPLQNTYDLLGFVYSKTGDYKSGIKYGLLAMQTAETFKDSVLLVNIYHRLGLFYKTLNQPEKAIVYFNKTLQITQKQYYKNTLILLAVTVNDAMSIFNRLSRKMQQQEARLVQESLVHLQKIIARRPNDRNDIDCRLAIASCYLGLYGTLHHQFARSQPYCDSLEHLLSLRLGNDYQQYIHGLLIPFYVNSGQYQKAYQHLVSNEQNCVRAHSIKNLCTNHLWWFKLDSAQGYLSTAIPHFQQYKALSDSLLNERTHQQVAQLEVQYQTREKEHNIDELLQRTQLQQSELQAAQTTRNLSVISAVLLVLLLSLGYNRYRLKQRNNELLETKQVEINQKNQSLQQVLGEKDHLLSEKEELLAEKEWMLKEIHHRVKNNLQIIASLLHSQGAYLKDHAAQEAIQESQNRVHAMALLHQKLYQSDRLTAVPMNHYIAEIVDHLISSFDRQDTIRKQLSIAPVELDITLAVPLGLIINEAVTNSLKYGFPADRRGTLYVTLTALTRQTYQLIISDDGIGLAANFDPTKSRTLGMSLIRGLSKQIGGTLQISQHGGVQFTLIFKEPNPAKASVSED